MAEAEKKPNFFQRLGRSFRDMKGEMKRVIWPSKRDVVKNTVIVLIFVVISGLIVSGIDALFSFLVKLLLKTA